MQSSLLALQPWLSGAHIQSDAVFDGVTTDSRNASAGNLFVALRGEHFDAHDFIAEVVAQGVTAVVVERLPAGASDSRTDRAGYTYRPRGNRTLLAAAIRCAGNRCYRQQWQNHGQGNDRFDHGRAVWCRALPGYAR